MKKILLALSLSAFLLSSCGTKDIDNSSPVEINQLSENTSNTERMEEPEQIVNTERTEEPEQMENTEQTNDTRQAEKEDVSGIYTDKQGTSDVYSQLALALQPNGTYAVEISIYRTTELEGTAAWEGDTLRFTSEDPYVLADISVTGSQAEVIVITDAADILTGDTYSFPDCAPGESKEQTDEDSSQQNLSEKIAMEISYAEEQEKEIGKKQEEAVTQLEMNATAAEMYQLWDDTLNIVWGLLEANLNEADMEVLRKEEREWIASKDAEVQAAGQESEGGSIQPLLEATKAAELTKAKVYELAEYAK